MGSFGTVPLKDVFRMLDECAPGFARQENIHHHWITYNGKTYRRLPKGGHGKSNPPIQIGHIHKMIRALGIDQDCAKKHLKILR